MEKVYLKKKLLIIGLSVLAFLFLLPFVVLCFNPWSEILCRHEEINIKTGQVRYSRYVYFLKITEWVEDTCLSDYVEIPSDETTASFWRRVNSFSPLASHSPHYSFHSALAQVHQLQTAVSLEVLTEPEKKRIVEGLLENWQDSDDYHSAGDYLDSVLNEAIDRAE